MIRIGIVDDHAIVRSALAGTLATHVDLRVVSLSATAAQAEEAARAAQMDLMVMDLALSDASGVEGVARVRKAMPSLDVLVYSGFPEELYGAGLVNMGVRGYVEKERDIATLVEAIRTVAQGGVFLSRQVRNHARDAQNHGGRQTHHMLSRREMDTFLILARGTRLTVAADELGVSVKTASTYRARILQKMAMTHNTEFTRYALAHKLIG
ncbi:response regulator transcription factor [soil metagenome]